MDSFCEFARSHGVEIMDLTASDTIRRCPTTRKPRAKNGAYLWDGCRGWVCAWDGDGEHHWYDDPQGRGWTPQEKRDWIHRRDAARHRKDTANKKAAIDAQDLVDTATPARHNYLLRKRLEINGLVLPDHTLVVPMRDVLTNAIKGAQLIKWNMEERRWEKRMLPGTVAKGAVMRLGTRRAPEAILCEGYATGLSIQQACDLMRLDTAVTVCFSASNVEHVAKLVRRSTVQHFVFADNDESQTGERAAQATALPYCMSPVVGEDANDLHARAGLMEVAKTIMKMRAVIP